MDIKSKAEARAKVAEVKSDSIKVMERFDSAKTTTEKLEAYGLAVIKQQRLITELINLVEDLTKDPQPLGPQTPVNQDKSPSTSSSTNKQDNENYLLHAPHCPNRASIIEQWSSLTKEQVQQKFDDHLNLAKKDYAPQLVRDLRSIKYGSPLYSLLWFKAKLILAMEPISQNDRAAIESMVASIERQRLKFIAMSVFAVALIMLLIYSFCGPLFYPFALVLIVFTPIFSYKHIFYQLRKLFFDFTAQTLT